MAALVEIVAGSSLASLWGRSVIVAGQRIEVGPEGAPTRVPEAIATRLLAQGGWRKVPQTAPPVKLAKRRGKNQ